MYLHSKDLSGIGVHTQHYTQPMFEFKDLRSALNNVSLGCQQLYIFTYSLLFTRTKHPQALIRCLFVPQTSFRVTALMVRGCHGEVDVDKLNGFWRSRTGVTKISGRGQQRRDTYHDVDESDQVVVQRSGE